MMNADKYQNSQTKTNTGEFVGIMALNKSHRKVM